VVDEEMQMQPAGIRGEIMLRGRSLFKGYWDNPEATRDAFAGGWFRTGDVGYTDSEGYFYVVDRIKNIVIVGSSNVYPIDLEVVLAECDDIAESAVVGCPDAETGEALVACVVLKSGRQTSEAEIKAVFCGRLAEYQHPKHILFMQSLPKTSLGKVQKAELASLAQRQIGVEREK
jgi:long-chain acyl-CoA synthetase